MYRSFDDADRRHRYRVATVIPAPIGAPSSPSPSSFDSAACPKSSSRRVDDDNGSELRARLWRWYAWGVRPWWRAGALLLLSFYINIVSGNVSAYLSVSNFGPGEGVHSHRLPDFVLDHVLPEPHLGLLPRLFADLSPHVATLWSVLLLLASAGPLRCQQVVRLMWYESIAFVTCALFRTVTTLPDASGRQPPCRLPEFGVSGPWLWQRLSLSFCGDMLFSLHTFHTLISLLVATQCLYASALLYNRLGRVIYYCWCVLATTWVTSLVMIILLTRLHYTVDVLLAVGLCLLLATHDRLNATAQRWLYVPPPCVACATDHAHPQLAHLAAGSPSPSRASLQSEPLLARSKV